MTITQQLEALASGPAYLPSIAVTRDFLRAVLTHIRTVENRPCSQCEELKTFDLEAHLSHPSRINPLAAAAAIHLVKGE